MNIAIKIGESISIFGLNDVFFIVKGKEMQHFKTAYETNGFERRSLGSIDWNHKFDMVVLDLRTPITYPLLSINFDKLCFIPRWMSCRFEKVLFVVFELPFQQMYVFWWIFFSSHIINLSWDSFCSKEQTEAKQIAETFNEYSRCQSTHDIRNVLNILSFPEFILIHPELHITITIIGHQTCKGILR